MSLINDALKRARQAPPVPVPNLQFRAADPPPPVRRYGNSLWPIVLCGGGLFLLGLLWEVSRHSLAAGDGKSPVVAVEESVREHASHREPAPVPDSAKAEFPPVASNGVQPEVRPPAVMVEQPSTLAVSNPTVLALSAKQPPQAPIDVVSNAAPPPESPPPALKLQGIVYNPRRPSAVISGRTLFLGDRIREFRVTAISADTVTLVGGGQTKTMSLSD